MTPDDLRRVVRLALILMSIVASAAGILLGGVMFYRTGDSATILGAGMNGIWILVPVEAAFGNELY